MVYPFHEADPLEGHDSYSASKSASEMVIARFRDSFFLNQGVAFGSAKAGNVIGGGDWSKYRLIPDAIRPWRHVLEPLKGNLILIKTLEQAIFGRIL